nr:helix-turn-helix transcriptional regulator [Faecalicatena sp.]
MYNIGKRIKIFRICKNMTQEQLASMLYIRRQTLSNYETGRRLPNIILIWEIADIFEISIDSLIGRKCPDISERKSLK